MGIKALAWRLSSPYDAYISHVSELNVALNKLRSMSDMAIAYETGLHGSLRLLPGGAAREERVNRFREKLGEAAAKMTDEEFEDFLAHLGGGEAAIVESDRARTVSRMSTAARGLEEYFAIAGRALAVLEERGYSPGRADVARQLRENHLPTYTVAEYGKILHDLGLKVGIRRS